MTDIPPSMVTLYYRIHISLMIYITNIIVYYSNLIIQNPDMMVIISQLNTNVIELYDYLLI